MPRYFGPDTGELMIIGIAALIIDLFLFLALLPFFVLLALAMQGYLMVMFTFMAIWVLIYSFMIGVALIHYYFTSYQSSSVRLKPISSIGRRPARTAKNTRRR